MSSLTDVFVTVKPDMDKFGPEVKKKLARIDAKKEGSQVATRFGVGFNGAIGGIVSRSAGIFAAGFASIKVGGFLKDAISQASDLGETTSKVSQIFGPAAKDILAFSKTSSTALGQTQQAALDANATFGIFGKSAGLKGKDLTGFTTKLTTLAGDLASFNNTSPEQAIEAIGAALRGETEPMRAYGVLLDDASLRQEALAQGLVKTTKEALTPQQKVLAAQALILKQTTTAQGDFARTSGGLANQQRILSARFTDFKTSLGSVALPLATKFFGFLNDKAIPVLGEIKSGITGFAEAFKSGASLSEVQTTGFYGAMERLGVIARQAFDTFKTDVLPRLKEFGGFIVGTVVPAVAGLVTNLVTSFAPAVKDVFGFFKTEVLPRLKDFAGFLGESVLPKVEGLATSLSKNKDFLIPFAATIVTIIAAMKLWAIVQGILNVVMSANPIGLVVIAIAALVAGIVWAYKNSETFRNILQGAFKGIQEAAQTFAPLVKAAIDIVIGVFSLWWNYFAKPILKAFWEALKFAWGQAQAFGRIISAVWDSIKEPARAAITYVVGYFLDFVQTMLDGAAKAFGWVPKLGDKLKSAAKEFGTFRDSVNGKLAGITDQTVNVAIKYSSKGVNLSAPSSVGRGMADGGGVFGGTRGKDSVPALLMPDEHVWTTKEVAAAGGHGAMKRMRQAALAGELNGYAAGGAVGFNVRTSSPSVDRIAKDVAAHALSAAGPYIKAGAKQLAGTGPSGPPGARQSFRGVTLNTRTINMLLNAERILGRIFHITQGSYSTRVAASGSTHAGGGAMDTNGPGGWNTAVRALRLAGFAAWHRTRSQGPWNDHIHSIALGDSSASPAAKAQMAAFRRGGDGLGHGMAKGGRVTKQMARDMGIDTFDTGGRWRSGTLAANTSGKTETVLRGDQMAGTTVVVNVPGVVGMTKQDLRNYLVKEIDGLRRQGRI